MQRVVYLDLKSIFARFLRASSEFLKYKKQTVRYRVNLLVISHACSRPVVGTERLQIESLRLYSSMRVTYSKSLLQ